MNKIIDEIESTECILCDIGLYADEYKINCLKCPKGRYNERRANGKMVPSLESCTQGTPFTK